MLWCLLLPCSDTLLDPKSAACRLDDAGKLAKHTVAHSVDDAAAVLGDEGIEELSAVLA